MGSSRRDDIATRFLSTSLDFLLLGGDVCSMQRVSADLTLRCSWMAAPDSEQLSPLIMKRILGCSRNNPPVCRHWLWFSKQSIVTPASWHSTSCSRRGQEEMSQSYLEHFRPSPGKKRTGLFHGAVLKRKQVVIIPGSWTSSCLLLTWNCSLEDMNPVTGGKASRICASRIYAKWN